MLWIMHFIYLAWKSFVSTLRDKMMFLHGQIAAYGFLPESGSHFDLWQSVQEQYEAIMNEVLQNKAEEFSRFIAPHLCSHQWKQVNGLEHMCIKCGERAE